MKKKKIMTEEQQSTLEAKTYFDMVTPGVIKFYPDYYICGNFSKFCWAVTEYPPTMRQDHLLQLQHEYNKITAVG